MRIVHHKIVTIVAEPLLSGDTRAYSMEDSYSRIIMVSPAIYELLNDPDAHDQIMQAVEVYDIRDLIQEELDKLRKTIINNSK